MTNEKKRTVAKVVGFGVPALVFGGCLLLKGTRDEKLFMAVSLSVLSAFISLPIATIIAPKVK